MCIRSIPQRAHCIRLAYVTRRGCFRTRHRGDGHVHTALRVRYPIFLRIHNIRIIHNNNNVIIHNNTYVLRITICVICVIDIPLYLDRYPICIIRTAEGGCAVRMATGRFNQRPSWQPRRSWHPSGSSGTTVRFSYLPTALYAEMPTWCLATSLLHCTLSCLLAITAMQLIACTAMY